MGQKILTNAGNCPASGEEGNSSPGYVRGVTHLFRKRGLLIYGQSGEKKLIMRKREEDSHVLIFNASKRAYARERTIATMKKKSASSPSLRLSPAPRGKKGGCAATRKLDKQEARGKKILSRQGEELSSQL